MLVLFNRYRLFAKEDGFYDLCRFVDDQIQFAVKYLALNSVHLQCTQEIYVTICK